MYITTINYINIHSSYFKKKKISSNKLYYDKNNC